MADTVLPVVDAANGPNDASSSSGAEANGTQDAPRGSPLRRALTWLITARTSTVLVASLLSGVIVSSVLIIVSVEELRVAWGGLLRNPSGAYHDTVTFFRNAYGGLLRGAFGDPAEFRELISNPSTEAATAAFGPLARTVTNAVPLAIAGLGLSIAYRSSIFNVGAESQIIGGAVAAGWVGFSFPDMPASLHVPLALLAALAGGAIAGFIPGILKAATGANEVIVTIMLNYVAANVLVYLLASTFFQNSASGTDAPIGRPTVASARLPELFGDDLPINLGLIVAIVAVLFTAVFLRNSRLGFELQIAGASRGAAATAGIDPRRVGLLALVISGAVVGLAGGVQVLGVVGQLQTGVGTEIGILAITVALVGRSQPVGIAVAALLYGALQSGGLEMQLESGVSYQLTNVFQAVIVFFMTAPAVVIAIYRMREPKAGRRASVFNTTSMASGWGA